MYTVRILDQAKSLLAVLPVESWKYARKISEITEFSVTLATASLNDNRAQFLDNELITFLSGGQPVVINEDQTESGATVSSAISYYIQLYRGESLHVMGKVAKRTIGKSVITLQARTEECILSQYRCPEQYGRKYDGWDIADIARDLLEGWHGLRIKAQSQWELAVSSSNIDTSTEPGIVILAKDGSGVYHSSGYIVLEFDSGDVTRFEKWERIRWASDSADPVFTTVAYQTYDGSSWSSWSAENAGVFPDELGLVVDDYDAEKVRVRVTLSTNDLETEDGDGDAVGSTPALFALEVIARTEAFLTGSIPISTGVEISGVTADSNSAYEILQGGCKLAGYEFFVFNGVLTVAEGIGTDRSSSVLMREVTNVAIEDLSDSDDEIWNVITAVGSGSGINRLQVTVEDGESIDSYGAREIRIQHDTEDLTELTDFANDYLDEHKQPSYSWKVRVAYPYGEEPEYGVGDIVKVVSPESGIIINSRIEEERRSYSSKGMSVDLYLNKTRADLTARQEPIYRPRAPIVTPVNISAIGVVKGIYVKTSPPADTLNWSSTRVYISETPEFTPSAENLSMENRATKFEVTGLNGGVRYYAKALHVNTAGDVLHESSEVSAVALSVVAEDIDIVTSLGMQFNKSAYDGATNDGYVFLHGLRIGGSPDNVDGFILTDGEGGDVIPKQSVQGIEAASGSEDLLNFLVYESGVVKAVSFDFENNAFKDLSGTTVTTGRSIGWFTVSDAGVVTGGQTYDRSKSITTEKQGRMAFALNYLSEAAKEATKELKSAKFDEIADALGIKDTFLTVAIYTAYIIELFSNNITLSGAIKSEDVDDWDDSNPGFWMGTDSDVAKFRIGDVAGRHIKWDGSELSGNVAYEEYDLRVKTDEDLELLYYSATPTQYKRVQIIAGEYEATEMLDLAGHGVEIMRGLGPDVTIIDLNFVAGASDSMVSLGEDLRELSGIRFTTSATQTQDLMKVLDIDESSRPFISNLKLDGFNKKGYGIYAGSSLVPGILVDNCHISGVYRATYQIYGIRNSYAYECYDGFSTSKQISSCEAMNNDNCGFTGSRNIVACRSNSNKYGFFSCFYISSCNAESNTTKDMQSCYRISATYAGTWDSCGYVDNASCNTEEFSSASGSQYLGSGDNWDLPAGRYIFAHNNALVFEVKYGSTWRSYGGGSGGNFYSDGSNMRIKNNGVLANTFYYRKYT